MSYPPTSRIMKRRRPTSQLNTCIRLQTEALEARELLASDLFVMSSMLSALSRGGRGVASPTSIVASNTTPSVSISSDSVAAPVVSNTVVQTMAQVSGQAISGADANNIMGDEGPGVVALADADDVVEFRLAVTNASGTPVTTVTVGDTFQLRGFVRSIGTQADTGVFAGFLDVTFNTSLATPSGTIGHGATYVNGTSGSVDGSIVNEVGGISSSSTGSSTESLLFQLPFTASAAGSLTFTGDPADNVPVSNTLLLGASSAVAAANIDYGSVTLNIDPAPVQDLVQFAKNLAAGGAALYGAVWDAATTEQKDLFQDGATHLTFTDVTNLDRTDKPIVTELNITEKPTWIFTNGQRLTGVRSLSEIATASGIAIPTTDSPSFKPIGNKTVLGGSPLMVAVDGYDPNNGPLTYTVTSSNPSLVTPTLIPQTNSNLRISTAGFGDMVFRLFDDMVPRVTNQITQLANDDFYNGVIFHRIISNFVIQGGDPTGTGGGGSPLGDFDDQFHVDLQHNQSGVLSMAKSNDDTNDSQFFITEGDERSLDYNHSLFGYLVEGNDVRNAIRTTPVGANDRPVNTVTMDDVSVFNDTENAVFILKAAEGATGSTTVTVEVTDAQGKKSSETFTVTVQADTQNSPPFLTDFSSSLFTAPHDTPLVIPVNGIDVEGDPIDFDAIINSAPPNFPSLAVDDTTKTVTVTPPSGFAGEIKVLIGAFPTNRASFDSQELTVLFTGIDLWEASDSGSSKFDNITNATNLEIRVTGVPENSTVALLRDGTPAGTAVAGPNGAVFNYDATANSGNIVFTAQVTNNGDTTTLDHQLTVTIDRVAPTVTSTAPTTVKKGQNIGYNVESSIEDTTTDVYTFTQNPTTATINAKTGVIAWTPGFTSTNTSENFKVRVTDVAGNFVSHDFTVAVAAADIAAGFTVQVLDLNGSPITSIAKGTEFQVRVLADDLRDGVALNNLFNVFVDMSYNSNLVSVASGAPLVIGPNFSASPISGGTNTQPGLIDEAGGSTPTTLTRGSDPMLVFTQRFIANNAGVVTFATARALHPQTSGLHVVNFVNPAKTADVTEISYGSAQLSVADGILANNDSFNVAEGSTTSLDVVANDLPAGLGTITLVGTPNSGGSVTINSGARSVTYTPAANFFGTETFTYTLSFGAATPSVATVTVNVANVNDPPTADDDMFNVAQDKTNEELDVLGNDLFAPDTGETLTITSVTQGTQGGTVSISPGNLKVRYTPPNATFTGNETFTYTINDGNGGTDTATVTVNVTLVAPDAPDLSSSTDTGSSATDNITNATSLDFVVNGVTSGATVVLRANGTAIGNPLVAAGTSVTFAAVDTTALTGDVIFTAVQTLNGSTSGASNPLTVNIDRTLPEPFTSTPDTTAFVGTSFTYDANVPNEASVVFSLSNAPATATINPTSGLVSWTPIAADIGTVSFSVNATDLAGNVRSQNVALTVADKQVAFTVRFVDPNNSNQEITSVGTGSIFAVQVHVDDLRSGAAQPGLATAFAELLFNDTLLDAVGLPTVNTPFGSPVQGSVTTGKVGATGGTTTTPQSADPTLLFTQRFRAIAIGSNVKFDTDFAEQANRTVTLHGQPSAIPEQGITFGSGTLQIVQGLSAVADTASVAEDAAVTTINVLTNDTVGPTSGNRTVSAVSTPTQNGTVSIAPDGQSVRYTPRANFFGTETFTYTVTDQSEASATGTVTVTVTSVNDPPTAVNDTAQSRRNGDAIQIDVLSNDSFAPDTGETLSISAVSTGNNGGTIERINNNTAIRYKPAVDFTGTETFTYTLADGNGDTAQGTVTVNVAPFLPTAVTGKIFFDTNGNGTQDVGERAVSGMEVKLTGTETSGAAVNLTTRTDKTGGYNFASVNPGSYTVTQTSSGLLTGGAVLSTNPSNGNGGITITPGNTGGQSGSNNFGGGGVVPQFNMLYALASTPRNPVEFASDSQGRTQWQILDDLWSAYQSMDVVLSADASSVTINVTETDGDRLTRTLSTRDTSLVQLLGVANGTRLVRLVGAPNSFGLQPVPNASTQVVTAGGVSSSGSNTSAAPRAAARNSALDAIFANLL